MNEPVIRKRRRRRMGDSTNISPLLTPKLSDPPADIKSNCDDAPSNNPKITISLSLNDRDLVSLICSELLKDNYHSALAESDYDDESHHWNRQKQFGIQ